ncbi:hypothetical protein AZ66_15665 [Paenibacillus sp. E194]|uniref:ABC transporter ATP-binding protein n=1 Tax=Paenibacillus sp. E194 TaxID=1458845 RepID=UPI0005C953BC|nr:ABC transporter ATP-binding protein [Paenibacillus sp. E194]KJB86986.1 hypothetical protein AZ66_15665 [Paenibacillus sp. E194]
MVEVLQIKDVTKLYGKIKALDRVTVEIQRGMFGLLGPNGAGKTSLMRILTTVIPPTGGDVIYGDYSLSNKNEFRSMIGYLPQKFSMYKHLTVQEVLTHIGVFKGINKNPKENIQKVLELVNLSQEQNKKVSQLSGGMVRRLGIAQAILGDPQILIVDEPTAGLDPEERIRFRKLLKQIGKQSIVIISTHIVEDIETTCDNAAIMQGGKIIVQDRIQEIGKLAEGKVWEIIVPTEKIYNLPPEWNVISTYRENDTYRIKVLSETNPGNGKPVSPSLEDGYLYVMRNK